MQRALGNFNYAPITLIHFLSFIFKLVNMFALVILKTTKKNIFHLDLRVHYIYMLL